MKIKHQSLLLSLLFVSAFNPVHSLFAQGKLEPPGAPAPMFRTLEEVQPRRPIGTNTTPGDANALFKITQPGSYYLTTNITGVAGKSGIDFTASDVTLDLMGFELVGVTNSGAGVNVPLISSLTNITVRNGTVRGWGYGVYADLMSNCHFQELRLMDNVYSGIVSGFHSIIVNCTAKGNGGPGIEAGDASSISGCTAAFNFGGISVPDSGIVSGCTATYNNFGIYAGAGSTISGCTASHNTESGISTEAYSCIVGNNCAQNEMAGIWIYNAGRGGAGNRLENNHVTGNGVGIQVDHIGNLIMRNSASGNRTNYVIVAGNKVGVIVAAPNSGAISGSTGGAGVGTTDPWANFSF